MWIKQILNVNIINFAKVDKGAGEDAYPQKVDNLSDIFLEPFPNSRTI